MQTRHVQDVRQVNNMWFQWEIIIGFIIMSKGICAVLLNFQGLVCSCKQNQIFICLDYFACYFNIFFEKYIVSTVI